MYMYIYMYICIYDTLRMSEYVDVAVSHMRLV